VSPAAFAIVEILLWGIIATLCAIAILFSAQNLGWTRLDIPFLLGAAFSGDRHAANVLGFVLVLVGGWLIAFFYYLVFSAVGMATWWIGLLAGLLHGVLLLTAVLPLLPHMHPRVASEYDGPTMHRRLEPPGFLALHYGYRTPLITLIAHAVYGVVLGAGLRV
jgi:hypothetical protein